MKVAASRAIAALVEPVSEENIIPSPLDRRVVPAVAEAVARAAIESGVARLILDPSEVGRRARPWFGLFPKRSAKPQTILFLAWARSALLADTLP